MLYNFSLDDLIPLLTLGAISVIAIYHTILFFFSRQKLVGTYTLYLWFGLCYLLLAITTVPQKTFNIPTLPYLISSGIFWISILCYLNFLLVILAIPKERETAIFKIVKKTYFITPIYFLLRFPYFFFPDAYVNTLKACGFIMDAYLFFAFIYLICHLLTKKVSDAKNYVMTGSVLLIFFNFFTSFTYYTQGHLFGLSHVSFIALGYFSDMTFFSLAVGLQMRQNLKDKYLALEEVNKKELALQLEKKKASEILLTHEFEVENERVKAIIEQRTIIGRKLHDDLSGNLVALKFLVQDYKAKATNESEQSRFNDLEMEISYIYKETRNYSHELSRNADPTTYEISYDVLDYLKKLKDQFSKVGLLQIHTTIDEKELNALSPLQKKHVYLLLKECITNTIKHTAAKNIWINFTFSEPLCTINYTDDGKGFKKIKEGIGIKGMKQRANELNGNFEIKSSKNGTSVIINFTLKS